MIYRYTHLFSHNWQNHTHHLAGALIEDKVFLLLGRYDELKLQVFTEQRRWESNTVCFGFPRLKFFNKSLFWQSDCALRRHALLFIVKREITKHNNLVFHNFQNENTKQNENTRQMEMYSSAETLVICNIGLKENHYNEKSWNYKTQQIVNVNTFSDFKSCILPFILYARNDIVLRKLIFFSPFFNTTNNSGYKRFFQIWYYWFKQIQVFKWSKSPKRLNTFQYTENK